MRKKVVLSADFSSKDVLGGAEQCNDELLKNLTKEGYDIVFIKSSEFSVDFLNSNKDTFFIISNFKLLHENTKQELSKNHKYCILEHNPAWVKSDNPIKYKNSIVPESDLQNLDFYKNAVAVLCQSKLHAETTQKNLLLDNVVNLGCNLWNEETLNLLEENLGKEKTRKHGIMESQNKNKGMPQTIDYCRKNNISFETIPFVGQKKFFSELAKTETLVFMPQWMETFCRVAIEARILGCNLITNKTIGAASEDYFELSGKELLESIREQKNTIMQTYLRLIEGVPVDGLSKLNLPKVTLISTFYNADEHIEGFIENIRNQTIFEETEIIFIDADSPGKKDKECVQKFAKENDNVKYIDAGSRITTAEAFNNGIEISNEEFAVFACVDDRLAKDHLEVLRKHLFLDEEVDLVYGDCLQTSKPNETIEQNSSRGRFYEHSKTTFKPENMIKCLPGPMPMFRKSMIKKHGGFESNLKFASDWATWLKCVRGGSKFKKVDKVVGLYYYNREGLSTSPENAKARLKEEASVFNEYKDVIGQQNYDTFKDYFNQVNS